MRIVVITGSSPNAEEGEQTKMEVVDVMEHTTKVCKASYPENVDEATAALVGNKMIVCGGKEAKKVEELEGDLNFYYKHSSIVGGKPLSHLCGQNSNVASAFRAIWE